MNCYGQDCGPNVYNQTANIVGSEPPGPVDPGIEASRKCYAGCITRLPCIECVDSRPMSYGGRPVRGYGLGAAPDVFAQLSTVQQAWVVGALNGIAGVQVGSMCPGSPAGGYDANTSFRQAVACFQVWVNPQLKAGVAKLPTDGTFTLATLCALIEGANIGGVTTFPDDASGTWAKACAAPPAPPAPQPYATSKTATVVGIGVAAVAAGGLWWMYTRRK